MKKITIIGALIIIAVVAWMLMKSPTGSNQTAKLDVADTVGTFYGQWLKAVQEPKTAKPTRAELVTSSLLSKSLQDKLALAEKTDFNPDPVLCQAKVPAEIATRKVFEDADKAEALVTSRDKKVTEEAIVTLVKTSDVWYIDNIKCSAGEFAPDKEFTFEAEGFLLKGSIPTPYNNKNWHLVYEENGVAGNVVPLIFDSKSQCISAEGVKSVCKPDSFKETMKASVRGQMTERGASVTTLEFVK